MAEIHVGENQPYATLARAAAAAKAGDRVVVHEQAVAYREVLRPPAGTTWVAAPGERPVIDGGWDGKTDVADKKVNQVIVSRPDVTLRGLVVRNVAGRGVSVAAGGDGFLMEDCLISDCYDGGFALNGQGTPVKGVTLRRVIIRRVSRSWVVQKSPTNVNGCCLVRWGRDVLFEDCSVVGGYGEGMAAGVETIGMIIRGCTIADTMHLAIYASNRAQDVLVEKCVICHTGDAEYRQGDGDVGTGIVVGDETRPDTKDDRWQHAENVEVRGCLVVGSGILFGVRNNLKSVPGAGAGQYDGYETRIQNLYVHHNTFVGGPHTKAGVGFNENPIGHPVKGRFENNVIILNRMRAGGTLLNHDAKGVMFAGNAWAGLPATLLPDGDMAIPPSSLVAPLADLPNWDAFELDNYRPRADSSVASAGLGALGPVGPNPPPPPPDEEEVDWAALAALAAEVQAEAVTAHMAADRVTRVAQRLENQIRDYQRAAEGGEES